MKRDDGSDGDARHHKSCGVADRGGNRAGWAAPTVGQVKIGFDQNWLSFFGLRF